MSLFFLFLRLFYCVLWGGATSICEGIFWAMKAISLVLGLEKGKFIVTLNLFLCLLSAVNINCYRALKLPTCWFLIFDIFFVTWSRGVVCSNNIILTYLVLDCLQAWPCGLPLNFDTGEHKMWQRLHYWHTALHLSLSFQSLF